MPNKIEVNQSLMQSNDQIAAAIRQQLLDKAVFSLNIMGSPGSGKTSLLETVAVRLQESSRIGVIEGDITTERDKERLTALGIDAVQISTILYNSTCHLNALMIRDALAHFDLSKLDILIIENVGNLVCPAEFDIGENKRIVVHSITEGEDKPLKYPIMFHTADCIVVNKMDLVPALKIDLKLIEQNIRSTNPTSPVFYTSATTKQGMDELLAWIEEQKAKKPVIRNA